MHRHGSGGSNQRSPQVISDPDNYRLVVKPLWPGNQMDVPTVFRAWKKNQKPIRWAEIAEFSGLKNANQAFRITYLGNKPSKELTALNKFLVIDALNQCAYFYDHEHRPEAVPVPVNLTDEDRDKCLAELEESFNVISLISSLKNT